jgi:hypothetical protein
MRFGLTRGHRRRLIALGELVGHLNHRPKPPLAPNYEKRWLDDVCSAWAIGSLKR